MRLLFEMDAMDYLEFIPPGIAIRANRFGDHGPKNQTKLEREARVLEQLIREGYLEWPPSF